MQQSIKSYPLVDSQSKDEFPFLLGIGFDGLIICNSDGKVTEVIVKGSDPNAVLCAAESLDHFLDSINTIKILLSKGINPKMYLNNY